MIDRTALLATLRPLVVELEDSIRSRVLETPEVAEHLEHEHYRAVASERTAMSLEEWRDGEITQAAVAWVLGCVFVRFLEDNGLIDEALISGPGGRRAAAVGHREEHFRVHPSHSDREYLAACFLEVAKYPAVSPLYDERHNPLWRLGPTADGARTMRETFTAIDPASGVLVHDFTDSELDTRFLGDLYQDLSEAAKKRYALLQTPEFVERFILDRTLDPAIDEFGLEEVRLIDPTCGSGHFLIGAFERLFGAWQAREPATTATVLVQRSLDQIAGVDLNPYATAIARFRLIIAALGACGIVRLAEAPALRLHLATGDSLLHGPLPTDGATMLFDVNRLSHNVAHAYESEDASELKEILGRGYHAVVGNPPYIAVQDGALRDAYRARYASCHGKYVMTVPFMERFFELAQVSGDDDPNRAGFVGKITGNNFMKREFGAPLVETFLPSVDVQTLIDASGAYIPGHGTPTILLFGRSRPPVASTLRVVDGIRGEPAQPADPAKGLVWSAIETVIDTPGLHNAFVRCGDVERKLILTHPMALGIGRDLRAKLDLAERHLDSVTTAVGVVAISAEDDVFCRPTAAWAGISSPFLRPLVTGDVCRDWCVQPEDAALFPYSTGGLAPVDELGALAEIWPWRTTLWARQTFARTTYREANRTWWEWHQTTLDRLRSPLTISWAFVATHNHFALERGGKVFGRTAPVIKLAHGASEEQHLALLGVLNSSVACFWFKQVGQNRGSTIDAKGARQRTAPWEDFYEISAKRVEEFPLPPVLSSDLARALDAAAAERATSESTGVRPPDGLALSDHLAEAALRDARITSKLISLQEELDWQALAAYGLVSDDLAGLGVDAPPIALGQRAFEIVLARQVAAGETETTWFERHGSRCTTEVPTEWPAEYQDLVRQRISVIQSDPDVGLIERPEHKRRWNRASWTERRDDAVATVVLDSLDDRDLWADGGPRSTNELTDELRRRPLLVEALELLADRKDTDLASTLRRLVIDAAVPHLAAQRLTDKGMRKREVWERTWEFQRAEDRGETLSPIPTPPKYAQADFRSAAYWKHRGKLDVPKERFVLIPNAERGADPSPVVGWAGWNERDLARALAGRVTELRQEQAADADQLAPLLAGVLELLPWIHQWHPERDPLYGGPPGAFFEGWLDGELAALRVTRDTLRAWRPPATTRGRKAKESTA
jgi:hypothetical protein